MASYRYEDRSGGNSTPVPDGDYILGVEAAEIGITKKGDEKIEAQMRVVYPLPAGMDKGPLIYDHLIFAEKACWKIDTFLKALEKQPAKGTELAIDTPWLKEHVVGRLCWATLNTEEYDKVKRNKIVRYITSGKPDPYKIVNVDNPLPPVAAEEPKDEWA